MFLFLIFSQKVPFNNVMGQGWQIFAKNHGKRKEAKIVFATIFAMVKIDEMDIVNPKYEAVIYIIKRLIFKEFTGIMEILGSYYLT